MLAVGRNIRLVASLTKVQHHYSLTNAFQLVFSGKAYCKVDFLSAKFSRSRTISYQSLLLSTTVLNDINFFITRNYISLGGSKMLNVDTIS